MRALVASLALAVAIAFALPASAATAFTAQGTIFAGSPAWYLTDACASEGATEGLESSCVALAGTFDGMAYAVDFDTVATLDAGACFYDADLTFLDCYADAVPAGAAFVAVGAAATGGTDVPWTFTIEDGL